MIIDLTEGPIKNVIDSYSVAKFVCLFFFKHGMVNMIVTVLSKLLWPVAAAVVVSDPSREEEPVPDEVDEESDLAGENIIPHIEN